MPIEASTVTEGGRARRLRLGMVGGGEGAFIGAVHRKAMALDGQLTVPQYDALVAVGVLVGLVVVVVLLAVAVVPLLLFGVELGAVLLVVLAGLAGRLALGRPARQHDLHPGRGNDDPQAPRAHDSAARSGAGAQQHEQR